MVEKIIDDEFSVQYRLRYQDARHARFHNDRISPIAATNTSAKEQGCKPSGVHSGNKYKVDAQLQASAREFGTYNLNVSRTV